MTITAEFMTWFRHEWTETVAVTQYLMEMVGVSTIPIVPNKVIKEDD